MPARRPASQVQRAHAFGERLRAIRRARKLKQYEVASQVPMSAGHLSRLETGDYGPPSDEVIERLAEVLQADPLELLRIAGRDIRGQSFEEQVLAELRELRAGMKRLESAIAAK
jgi:transcriptional regulator with XRE-family HTH domain